MSGFVRPITGDPGVTTALPSHSSHPEGIGTGGFAGASCAMLPTGRPAVAFALV
eukprot:gene14461-24132_t